jgi:hypothetical protein
MQTIYIDVSNKGVIPTIYAKQGDVGRKVEVILTSSSLPYEPEAGSAFSAWFSGASGVGNYTDIGDHSAFSVSGNKVTVELITQMLQNPGDGFLCLVLNSADGNQLGMWNIPYICEAVPGAGSEAAQQYYTAFSEAVAGLAYPDASLSVYGKAADAGATGAALAQKAPSGYGLGGSGKLLTSADNLDNVTANGWYWWYESRPVGALYNYCVMRVDSGDRSSKGYVTQTIHRSSGGGTIVRYNSGGTWYEELVNPPMELGKEYRTTERLNGKAVYAKAIDCGALPNTNTKTVALTPNSGSCTSVIGYGGTTIGYGALPNTIAGIELSVNTANIMIKTNADRSSGTAVVWVKYTKD